MTCELAYSKMVNCHRQTLFHTYLDIIYQFFAQLGTAMMRHHQGKELLRVFLGPHLLSFLPAPLHRSFHG